MRFQTKWKCLIQEYFISSLPWGCQCTLNTISTGQHWTITKNVKMLKNIMVLKSIESHPWGLYWLLLDNPLKHETTQEPIHHRPLTASEAYEENERCSRSKTVSFHIQLLMPHRQQKLATLRSVKPLDVDWQREACAGTCGHVPGFEG